MKSISELIDEYEASRNVGRDPRVGPSDYGGCGRQVAYRVRGHEPGEPVEQTRAATMGTLFWQGLGEWIAGAYPDAWVEQRVRVPGLEREGASDLVWIIDGVLVDVKTVSDRAFDYVVKTGAKPENIGQVETYALGLNRDPDVPIHGDRPQAITRLRLEYVNRENGDVHPVEWDYDEQTARRKVSELVQLEQMIDAGFEIPRAQGARLGAFPCDWCPFWRECWDVENTPDDRSHESKFTADDEVEGVIEDYFRAQAVEAAAKRDKDAARSRLVGIRYDSPTVALTWSGNRPKVEDEVDVDALVARTIAAGETVPMRTVEKRTPWRINLKRKAAQA